MSSSKAASKNDETVKVVVRCRPLSKQEMADGRKQIVEMDVREGSVRLKNPKADPNDPAKMFTYDQVYDWNTEQVEIFNVTAKPIVECVMQGYNGTIFAYGQTGTGKSHTMEGSFDPATPHLRGITPNSFDFVFDHIQEVNGKGKEFLVYITYLEIYNEEVRDLLCNEKNGHTKKLELKENIDKGVYVKDLSRMVVKSVADMNGYLRLGKKHRVTGATAMNDESSRSHSIFTVIVECKETYDSGASDNGDTHIRVGKLNLVDLAGSERQSKTGTTGDQMKEGIKINMSLTALGNVIESLVSSAANSHVPYRDSKLTRLLQDSLGGNTKTVMVANIGPADWNYDETLSTLRYANRAKNIKNKPKINEDPKDAMLREVQEEIMRLKEQLANRGGAAGGGGVVIVEKIVETELSEERVQAIRQQVQEEVAAKLRENHSAEAIAAAKAEAEASARAQLEAIMSEAGATTKQKEEALAYLHKQNEEIGKYAEAVQKELQAKEKIEAKLKTMEERVLHGGENMVEKMSELKKLAKETKANLDVARRQQEEDERRMKALQDETEQYEEQFGTLKEQAEAKTRKLKRLYVNYQAKKSEAKDLNEEFQGEREEILSSIRELTQQIKLKDLIIALFIPPEFQEKIMKHAQWDDYDAQWSIDAMQCAGNAIKAQRDLATAEEMHMHGLNMAVNKSDPDLGETLTNVYFTYKELEDELMRERGEKPGSKGRVASGRRRPGTATRQ